MEFFAVEKSGVFVYTFRPGEPLPDAADPDYTFPPVPIAEGCVWSSDGALLGLVDGKTGGVAVYDAAGGYELMAEIPPLAKDSMVRCFYFSPMGSNIVTYERYSKESGSDNVGLWDAHTGELKWSFILKKFTEMSWPPLKWTSQETHCCRMVADGLQILPGSADRSEGCLKVDAEGIIAFEVAPRGPAGSGPHVIICIGESRGQPAKCKTYNLDDPHAPTAMKSFFKVNSVEMVWNNTGSAVLVKAIQDVDDTGKNYYGNTNLYFMRSDGQEDCRVAGADAGPVHDVKWCPTQDEFILLHGDLPCSMALLDGRKAAKRMDFGVGHRNTVRWNPFGRFAVLGGFGQLVGDMDFWDKPGKKLLGKTRMDCCVVCDWSPEGRHFLGATTSPRMRVDNKIQLFDYCGRTMGRMEFGELLMAGWRPRTRGGFQDRPPSPGRGGPADAAASKAAAPKSQAYRPPGARGLGGGLAAQLRSELGSTSAEVSATATKVFGAGPAGPMQRLPPGASAQDVKEGAAASNRNARKKKAKEAAEEAAQKVESDKLATARAGPASAPPVVATQAPADFKPAARVAAGEESFDNPEVEKKVRALRKKVRDIQKLKEKPDKELDVLQRQKLTQEAELISQIRELGAEP